MSSENNKLTSMERLGYGLGSIGESAIYILYSFYSMFFLTDFAKLDAISAGAIISISTVANAVFVIYLGHKSDNCQSKAGRRIPFMRAAIIPAVVFSIMAFTVVDLPHGLKFTYYMIVILGIIGMHTLFVLPYEALGAEITDDLDDRNSMRNYAKFFMGIGTLLGLSLTSLLVDVFATNDMAAAKSWQITIVIVAVISGVCLLSSVLTLRKKAALKRFEKKETVRSNILREYFGVIKIKPFKYLLFITALCSMNFAFSSPAMIYFMTYNMGLAGRYQSIIFIVITIANIAFTPITAFIARKICKEKAMLVCFIISGISLIVFAMIEVKTFVVFAILTVLLTIGNSAYYQLIFPMYYDISILDKHWNGKEREGTILSTAKTTLRLFSALGTQLMAIMLACFGYDEMSVVQSTSALMGIKIAFMLVPGILYLVAAVCVYLYPVTEEKLKKIIGD